MLEQDMMVYLAAFVNVCIERVEVISYFGIRGFFGAFGICSLSGFALVGLCMCIYVCVLRSIASWERYFEEQQSHKQLRQVRTNKPTSKETNSK
jgi:hypothetical protein